MTRSHSIQSVGLINPHHTTMKTENESQQLHMNHFIVKAILPGGKAVSAKVYATDKQGAKQSIWRCQPHAIVESVEAVSPY